MARQHPTPLLQLSHNGWVRDDLHSNHGRCGANALEEEALQCALDAMDCDAELSVSVHSQHGWMDNGGGRSATMAGLRLDANVRRLFSKRIGRQRTIHVAWVYGHVHRA